MWKRERSRVNRLQCVFFSLLTAALSLAGSKTLEAQTTVSASSVSFGNVALNQASSVKSVTYKNTGSSAIPVTLGISGLGYAIAPNPATTCGGSLNPGASCVVGMTFTPGGLGVQPGGTLNITATPSSDSQAVSLSGAGVPTTRLSPTSLAFGTVAINTTSPTQQVTLWNNQASPLTITSAVFNGPFGVDTSGSSPTTCPHSGASISGTLAAKSSCVIGLTFAPTALGATSGGMMTVLDSDPSGPVSVALSGTGAVDTALSASAISFPQTMVNGTSAPKNVVLYNNLAAPLTLTSISVSAPFNLASGTTTCAINTPIPANKTCILSLTFSPTALGPATPGTLTVQDNAIAGTQTLSASLVGTGVQPIAISPGSMNFGTVVVNEQAMKAVTLKNFQPTPLTISSISGFPAGYSLDSTNTTCPTAPSTLAAGASCTIAIDLTATALGSQPGTITVAENSPIPTLSFPLVATAIAPASIAPTGLSFASQLEGTVSAPQTLTLKNQQLHTPLTISSVDITGPNSADFGVTSLCPNPPSALAAATQCTISVTFKPTGSGNRIATLNVSDGAFGSPLTVALKGSGSVPVTVLPGTITAFSAAVGVVSGSRVVTITNTSATDTLQISSLQLNGDFQQTATSCGATASAPPPYTLTPGASCTVNISFSPTVGGTRTGQLQVYDSAFTSPQIVNLQGTGNRPLTTAPTSLSFSAQLVNTTSPAKTIVLTNHESKTETFTLTPTGDFTANSNCPGGTIAANSSCNIFVNFVPSSTNPTSRTGSLSIAHSAAIGSPLTIGLAGSATATNPAAAVAVVSPGAGAAGTAVNVVITGNGWTHFSAQSVVSFTSVNSSTIDPAITVSNLTAVSPNQLTATLNIAGSAVFGARNISVQTPLSGGGTETAKLVQAFTVADPTNAHSIVSVTPAFGTQGQTLNVALTASGTHFVQGTTFANFGDGIQVNSLTITDATHAQATISISNTTPVGYRAITLTTGGEFATSILRPDNNQIFQIGPNSAALLSLSPNSAPQGASLPVTITASGTHFLQNATQLSISGGVLVGDVTVTSPTTAVAQVAVTAGASIGLQNATVSTGGEIATLSNAFSVSGATPALVSVSPSSGQQGQTLDVNITGNAYTNFSQSAISANFTGEITVNSVTVNSPSSVTANITIHQNANVGGITANLISGPSGSATIFPFAFNVTPSSASIVSVSPSSVPQGGQVSIAVVGSNTHWTQADTQAAFVPLPVGSIQVNEITVTDATHATLAISISSDHPVEPHAFYMSTGGEIVYSSVSVYANTPTLTMNPANGLVPSGSTPTSLSVSFTGQFTHWQQGSTVPVVAGQGVTLTNFTVTSLVGATATLNIAPGAATGARLVTFTTGGEIVTTNFNVTSTPVGLISISPYHAAQNATLDVAIVGLNTHFTAGTTQVLFGPQITVNSVTVTDATHLTANISTSYQYNGSSTPTPPGGNTVYVNTGTEQVIGGFSVDPPATPRIEGVSPSSAAQGSTVDVTITGSLTNWVQGTSELILGAGVTVSNLTITSPTTATATIAVSPTAPLGGNSVIMITGSEIDSGTGFSVTPSAAQIVSVGPAVPCDPNFAPYCAGGTAGPWQVAQLRTTTLNIVGQGTHWLQGETTVSFGAGVAIDQLTVTSPTTATVEITVLSSAPVGFASLTTNTDGEVVTLAQAIDIEEGSPKLLAFSPGGGQQAGTMNVQVLGRFTHWQQGATNVAFNQDITVNSVQVIDSENLIANVTVSPWAYVDFGSPCGHVLIITTGSEQVSTAPNNVNYCVSQGAEQINSVSPLSGIQGSTETLTITGAATNFLPGVTQVSFGDANFQVGQINVTSPTSLTVPVAISTAASTGYKTITVTTYGQVASQQYSFTVTPGVATLNEAIPNQAQQGVQNLDVHLVGQYSHFSAQSTATFGPGIVVNSVTYLDATDLTANITIDPVSFTGIRNVTVTTPGVSCAYQPTTNVTGVTYAGCTPGSSAGTGSEIVNNNAFSIIPGPAIITNISPATGNEGQEVVMNITGLSTHWQQNFTQFYIAGGGSDITINSVVINSATSATVDMSISPTANPGARSIFMVTAGESLTDSGAFVVTGGIPVVTYLSPNSALQGTSQLKVTINGLYTEWNASTTVSFGPGVTVTSYQVDDATHIEAVVNVDSAAQPGYRTVVVQTGAQVLTGNFQVTTPAPPPTPYIWYESPSSGIPGQTLTINFSGANTHWDPNPVTGTQLTGFNSDVTLNSFQVTSPTSALANVTISGNATASTSDLTLTTGSEVDSTLFSVIVAQPTLSIVDPGNAMQGAQNITVNILGQFTNFSNATTFNFGPGITVNGAPTILGPTIATQSISIGQETASGGYPVTATTGTQVVGGAYFSVTPSLATIIAVSPNTAKQGDSMTIEVTGQNTHWDGSTSFQLGAGIVVTTTSVNSPTDATLTIVVPPLASEGPTSITARTSGEVASLNNAFVVQPGTPMLLSSGPGSLPQQSSATFTILSQATQWSSVNPPTVDLGPGVVLTNVQVTGPTSLTVNGYVQPTTNVGYRNLTVSTATQTLNLNNAFYVVPGPAVVNSVSPNNAGQGVNLPTVQIKGTNTHWLQGVTTLSFPNVLVNSFTVNSPTSITANVTVNTSAPAGQVSVSATTAGETANGVNLFTITQTQPELLSVVQSSGFQGQTQNVVLTGFATHFSSSSVVSLGAGVIVNSVSATSNTSLTANITVQPTATLGYRNVSVVTGSEAVALNNAFQITTGPAAIASLNPASGGQGQTLDVQVTGSQTNFASGVTTAAFGGGISVTGITITDALHATVTVSIPNSTALGSYNVSLTTGGEVASILGGFTVNSGAARLSSVTPPTGTQGSTNQNITLTGLFTHFVNGTSVANFGSGITVNSTTVSSSTSAVANITISPTATIASRNVSVTTGSETATITGGFSVLAGVPSLLSASPASAQAGSTANVVVNGQFTSFQQGVSTVSFGSGVAVNIITVNSATQLTANITVAANATVGSRDISVTTNGQTQTLSNGFNVTAGTPIITQINPNIGTPGNTVSVTITGQYTNWTNGTTTASFGPNVTVNSVTVSNPTTLTASITIPSAAPLGPVDVTTTTNAEVETIAGGFTVQAAGIPPPSLLSLSPGANAGGMPINSSIIAVFSQPMDRTTITNSTVILYLTSNPGGWVTVPGTVSVDATGRVMTFTPTSLLAVNSQFYFELTNGIKDATGNTFNTYVVYLYTTDAANVVAPTVIAANPPANSAVGTNVAVQLEFSSDMNQTTASGLTLSSSGGPVSGTYSWNSNPYGNGGWGPGTVLTFTPVAPLQPNTTYTVAYSSSLADTAGNALVPGSFNFVTGSGADTAQGTAGITFSNYQTDLGTNFVPGVTYSKPVNPLDINTGTLLLYNADSGKYIQGTVQLAVDGKSAKFIPSVPLLPDTFYRLHQSSGNYDVDGNYLYGVDGYFTTGAGTDTTAPSVTSVSPTSSTTNVPLNGQVTVHFSSSIDQNNVNVVTLTPSGGSAISGTPILASDLVTLTFVPTGTLQANTTYTVKVSGFTDLEGNVGSDFTSTFTTAGSAAPIVLSTGLDVAGNVLTIGDAVDAHWSYSPTSGASGETGFVYPGTTPLKVVAPGSAGWYGGWVSNGPSSSWIAINPDSASGNSHGFYSTAFSLPSPLPSGHLCLAGSMSHDDNGLLALNGVPIMSDQGYTGGALTPLNIDITSQVTTGTNYLTFGFGSTDNYLEAFRLQAVVETCGSSYIGNLSLVNAAPSVGTTNVPTNTSITLQFNNVLDPATVNSSTLPVMIGWNSNQVVAGNYQVSGNQVVFTPDSPFPTNTQIYVGNCNGPYDLAGDTYPGCYGIQWEYFTTGSTSTPASSPFQVLAFTPANNASNVGLRAPVVATFNRSFNPGTINPNAATADFALFAGDGQSPWCSSYSRSQDNTTLQFTCYPLPGSSTMTAMLNSNLKDWQGNGLANFTSQFATAQYDSNTNGGVITSRPGNGASGVSANQPLVIFTNLPVDPATANSGIQVAVNNAPITGTVQVMDGGYTLQFTPATPFAAGALVQWWTTSNLLDATYETPINSTNGYFYVAADTSTLTPAVQVSSPPAYSGPVARNTVFDVQFNTPLDPATVNSTNIYLYDSSTGLNVPATYSMPQPNQVRMVPQADLSANAYIYVYVKSGLHSSTSVPAANGSWYAYTGTTDDTTAPTIVSAVPFNGAGNVGVNVAPGVVFSKPIDPVSLNNATFQVSNGSTPLVGSFWISSDDLRVEFVPNAPLPASANLTMNLNGVLDRVGHAINFTSSFQTAVGPDFQAPYVVWTSIPANGSTPTNASMTLQFNESMDVTTFNTNNVRIYDTLLGTNIAATLTWSSDQSTGYLTPTQPLAAGRQYYFSVNGGTDLAGNQVQGTGFYFYAEFGGATSAPTVVAFNPLSGATGVGTNVQIQAQFSAPVDPNSLTHVTLKQGGSTIPATPSLSAGNTVLQLVPQAPLAANTTYVMTIAGVKDPAGNALSTVTSTFTTGATFDLNPPSAINSDPSSNATVGTNIVPKFVFNKPLNPLTINTSTFRLIQQDTGQWIPLKPVLSADGLTVTMQPQIPLLANTEYHVQACCGYQDQDGNYGNQADVYFWTNSGSVSSGPTVSVSPIPGASGIPLNAQVLASISAPIDPTSWNQNSIQLLDSSSTPVAGTVSLSNPQMLVFAPVAQLSAGMTYTVKVSGFTDANGNAAVPSNTSFTTGSTAATGGLSLTSTNITWGATITDNLQPITLVFSQILDPATVNANTLKVMNGWNSYNGLAGTYTVNGNSVTFTPSSPYPAGASIYVGECGGPTDVLGEVFQNGNCYPQQLVYFIMSTASPDGSPFQVVSVSPANGATNVGHDQPVSVTFNKSANPGSAGSYNAELYAGQSPQDFGSVSWSADNRTMTFNVGALYNGTDYTIVLPIGGVSDMSGNSLADTYVSTFTTNVNPATGNPSVVWTTPSNGASGVPADALITFYLNRPVDPATLNGNATVTVNGQVYPGTLQAVAGGYEVQYTPSAPFPNGATIQGFWSSNILDIYGNAFNSSGESFTIAPHVDASTAQPVVVAVSPGYGSNNIPTNAEIDIQYSQPIDPATLTTSNLYFNNNIAITITQLTPYLVRVTPAAPLSANNTYYFCANGNVKGTNGVATPGNCWTTYFTTSASSDTTSGHVDIGPPDSVVNVGTNAYIRLQFSKPADRTTVNSDNVQVKNGSSTIEGTWSYNYNGNDVIGANFTPLNALPASSVISVTAGNLLDYAGNAFNSLSTHFTTAATPDYSNPSVSFDFPYNTSNIGTNAVFTCRYTEPMDPSSINGGGTYVWDYSSNARVPVTYTHSPDLMAVTMTPAAPLAMNSQFNYSCNNALDLTGNSQYNGGSVLFYTGSGPNTSGPALVAANPPSNATNVPLNTNNGPWNGTSLGLLFNEPVAPNSLGGITLTPNGGSPIPIGLSTQIGNTAVVVQLPSALQPNTTYTYSINGVTDYNGNPVTPATSTFTTGSGVQFSNPSVTAVSPVNGTTGVADNIAALTVTFNEAMDPVLIDAGHIYLRNHNTNATVPTTFVISSDYKTVTLTPTSPLAAGTIYDLVTASPNWYLTDISGNPYYNTGVVSTFTTQ